MVLPFVTLLEGFWFEARPRRFASLQLERLSKVSPKNGRVAQLAEQLTLNQ